jgi:biopolymer transport protein ExbB
MILELIQNNAFLLNSAVVWAIFVVAFVCYGLLIDLAFVQSCSDAWYENVQFWTVSLKHMLTSLPLLGLLGTITGLLKTFHDMAVNKGIVLQEVITGGIGEAMFTTQLGLCMVVPGLLMLAYLNYRKKGWIIRKSHEIVN